MVLAIEMGVVFVLLTAILIALYVAWQNAKFIGDRLRKKQVMKRLVAGGAAIVLAVAVAIGAVVRWQLPIINSSLHGAGSGQQDSRSG